MALLPSSPPPASATIAGLMSTTAQILAGLKTFQIGTAGTNDVTMRIGTTAAAPNTYGAGGYRALSILTGIGGSEVEWMNVRPEEGGSDYTGIINLRSTATNKAAIDVTYPGGGPGYSGGISWATWNGGSYVGPYSGQQLIAQTTNRGINIYTQLDAYLPAGTPHVRFGSTNNGGSDPTRPRFSFETDAMGATVRHSRWMVDGVERMSLRGDGKLHLHADQQIQWDDVWSTSLYAGAAYLYTNSNFLGNTVRGTYQLSTSGCITAGGGSPTYPYNHIAGYAGAGASDVANIIGTYRTDADTHASAKLLSIRTDMSGATPVEKLHIVKDGTIELTGSGVGIVLASPNGTRYRLTVTNAGALNIAAA